MSDQDSCEHDDYDVTGKMESSDIDGMYYIPAKCNNCGMIVYEEYEYNGVVTSKNG